MMPAAEGLVDLRISAPCEPYARVDIAYGPFILTEETSDQGRVDLHLPRLSEMQEVAAQIADSVLFAGLPAAPGPRTGYVALIWSGPAELRLELPEDTPPDRRLKLGFPLGIDARRAEILLRKSDAEAPGFVDIAVSGAPCAARPVQAAIVASGFSGRVPLTLPSAACTEGGAVLRVGLPPSTP